MSAPVVTEPGETLAIQASLDTILRAITDHDRAKAEALDRHPGRYKIYSIAELMREGAEQAARTPAGRFTHNLAADPVRAALKHAVRQIGKRLYEIGGIEALRDACERIADLDPPNWGKRTDIMDKTWDGIGGEWFA